MKQSFVRRVIYLWWFAEDGVNGSLPENEAPLWSTSMVADIYFCIIYPMGAG